MLELNAVESVSPTVVVVSQSFEIVCELLPFYIMISLW